MSFLSKTGKAILTVPNLSWQRVVVYGIIWTALCASFFLSPFGEQVDTKIRYPIDFALRSYLGKDVTLHKKIKILAVDDRSVAKLKGSTLELEEWYSLLKSIRRAKPKTVFIDKIFGIEDYQTGAKRRYKRAEKKMRNLGMPIVAGAFVAPKAISYRHSLNLKNKAFQLDTYVDFKVPSKNKLKYFNELNLPHSRGRNIYGPYPGIRRTFRRVGHIQYSADNKIAPMLHLNTTTVLPHFGLYAADKILFTAGKLHLNDKQIPVLADGNVPVNFVNPRTIAKRVMSISAALTRASIGRKAKGIDPGDTVIILPLYYTGNTDFKDTPFGQAPASFAHISFINSVLTNDWIKPVNAAALLMTLVVIFGVLVVWFFSVRGVMILGVLGTLLIAVGGTLAFSYLSISVPWLSSMIAYFGVVVILNFSRSRVNEAKSNLLRNTLDGAISPKELHNIIRNPTRVNLEAREQVVTVMFIDVVGYSLMAENQIPRVAFEQLKTLLGQLSEMTHKHGGIVNKTLGDGLLCLFGYTFENDSISTDHAEKAVACSIRIQEQNLKANLRAAKSGEPVFPLRIGLHTASVFLGDLGTGDRIDFTAVGNGVNYAKRMEQACDIHSVLMSSTTKDLVASLGLNSEGLKKRMISIKHHTNLIEAFEYDPFYKYPDARSQALEAYRHCASLARMEQRYSVNNQDIISINSNIGKGHLINYSVTGVSVKLKSMLVKGSTLHLKIDSLDGSLGTQLQSAGITEVKGEVRWVYSEADGHVHGVLFRNLTENLSASLVEVVKHFDLAAKISRSAKRIA